MDDRKWISITLSVLFMSFAAAMIMRFFYIMVMTQGWPCR
jgi:hypothetical protein